MGNLAGKTVLTFGDSIVDGHLYKKAGFMELIADNEGMIVKKYANNGACIMPGNPVREDGIGGMILTDQVMKAAGHHLTPEFVVFDGGTNDAYEPVLKRLGDVREKRMDVDTFAGAFRKTIDVIQKSWPKAIVVYVAVHRLGARDRLVQEELHRIQMAVCAEMGVVVANLYDECALDTADEKMRRKYSFDILKDGLPAPGENPTGTHPNLEAIKEFYVPFVTNVLKNSCTT